LVVSRACRLCHEENEGDRNQVSRVHAATLAAQASPGRDEAACGLLGNGDDFVTKLEVVVFESLGLRVDTGAYRAELDGRRLELEPKAFDLLVFLLSNPQQLVTKQQLLDAAWQGTAVTDNALTRVVAQLRKALGDDAREAKFLETIPTRGYRWIPAVARSQQSVGTEPPEHQLKAPAKPRRHNIARYLAAATAVIAAVALGAWAWFDRAADDPRPVFPRQLTMSAGVDLFPALSPDGDRLAYSSDRSGKWEIYISPTAGGPDVSLTKDGNQNVQAAWSPDGRHIAFHSMVRGGIWITPVDGGSPRQIAEFGARPAWSPDGRLLAFQTDAATDIGPAARPANLPSTIWVVETSGGQPRPLTRRGVPVGGHGAPTWSPDGRHVAFSTSGFALSQIWAVDVHGGEPFPLVTDSQVAVDGAYLPDGRALLFTDGRLLWRMPLDAEGRKAGRPVSYLPASLDGLRHLSVARNGRVALSALDLDASLWSITIDTEGLPTGEPRPLTNDTRRRNSFPAFSPDGRRIAVMSSVAGGFPDIWTMNADGAGLSQLTDDPDYKAEPSWTPDGREVIFKAIRNGSAGLWAIDVVTRRERRLMDFGPIDRIRREGTIEHAAVSPDATRVTYTVLDPRTSSKALYLREMSKADAVRLTTGEPPAGYPAWSPDGNWIALELFEPGGTDAAVVAAASGALRRLTSVRGQSWVHGFSPDSARVLFAGQRNGVWNIYWVPRDGGDEHRITNNTRVGVFMRYPAWSPQNDQIVYENGVVRGNVWLVELR
jgi:Tol biopolymer transport system component/DNA-binding winged helix-turn-helix (wHTH) protein